MTQLSIIATITVKPEFQDALKPIFKRLVTGSRAEQVVCVMSSIKVLKIKIFI